MVNRNKNVKLGYNETMKVGIIFSFLILFTACTAQTISVGKIVDTNSVSLSKPAVLVELFTSEGCSSCPAAERVLSKLETKQPFKNAQIITLALHVDYWNYMGWKDRFSSSLYTQRQRVYDRKFRTGAIYTPQMVVDGSKQFVGSNIKKAEKAINKAAREKKAKIDISLTDRKLGVSISNIPDHKDASVYLAITEDHLKSNVRGGENAGKKLRHVSVVRSLTGIGRIAEVAKSFETQATLQIKKDWKKKNLKVVLFIQENQSRKILGVRRIHFE